MYYNMAQSIYKSLHDKGAIVKLHKLGRSYHQRGSSLDSGTPKNAGKVLKGVTVDNLLKLNKNHAEMH